MTPLLKIYLITALAAITLSVRAGDEDGRYKLVMAHQYNGNDVPYVIDTQTGRVWHQTFDSEKNIVWYQSINYGNVEGDLSKVPNETTTGVILKGQNQATVTPPITIPSPTISNTVEDLEKLAESGDANAQYKLGNDYMYGAEGKSIDNVLALKWLLISSKNGSVQAAHLIDIIKSPVFMSPEQIGEAQRLSAAFVPQK